MSSDNALKQNADQYLRKHRIIELMEDLCSDLCYEQPQNINEFLIERIKLKQKQGNKQYIQDLKQVFSARKKLLMFLLCLILKSRDRLTRKDVRKPLKLQQIMSFSGNKQKLEEFLIKLMKKDLSVYVKKFQESNDLHLTLHKHTFTIVNTNIYKFNFQKIKSSL